DTGLLWWAPLALLGLGGLCGLARRGDEPGLRSEARVFAAIFALFLVITASLSFSGGWRIGPRYLVVALPAMVPGIAWLLGHVRSSMAWMTAIAALGTWSLALNGLAANLWPHLDPTNIDYPLGEVLVPLVRGGRGPHDVLTALGGGGLPLAWLVTPATIVAGLGGLAACARGSRARLGVGLGVALGGLAIVGSLALPPHPRAAANLRYIERVWEPDARASAGASASARLGPLSPADAARCRSHGR
ncbi:MAG: hypothetical protein KC420_01015, partial [Myxococcales bacterium]|nr:hypothetical protein [Myxococcales bacterium]